MGFHLVPYFYLSTADVSVRRSHICRNVLTKFIESRSGETLDIELAVIFVIEAECSSAGRTGDTDPYSPGRLMIIAI